MNVFCVKNLGRLPCEVEAPMAELRQSMIAWSVAQERLEQELKSR